MERALLKGKTDTVLGERDLVIVGDEVVLTARQFQVSFSQASTLCISQGPIRIALNDCCRRPAANRVAFTDFPPLTFRVHVSLRI